MLIYPDPGIEPRSPALQVDSLALINQGSPVYFLPRLFSSAACLCMPLWLWAVGGSRGHSETSAHCTWTQAWPRVSGHVSPDHVSGPLARCQTGCQWPQDPGATTLRLAPAPPPTQWAISGKQKLSARETRRFGDEKGGDVTFSLCDTLSLYNS